MFSHNVDESTHRYQTINSIGYIGCPSRVASCIGNRYLVLFPDATTHSRLRSHHVIAGWRKFTEDEQSAIKTYII